MKFDTLPIVSYQTMLPEIWVTWISTKNRKFAKRYWLDCQTGEKIDTAQEWMNYNPETEGNRYGYDPHLCWRNRNEPRICVKNGAGVKMAYVKYHDFYHMLEVAVVGIDTTRTANRHYWKYLGDRIFIKKDKSVVDTVGNPIKTSMHLYEYHDAYDIKRALSIIKRLQYNDKAIAEIRKFIGESYTKGNGSIHDVVSLWSLEDWYASKQKDKITSNGKQQLLTDKLTAIPVSDMSKLGKKYPRKTDVSNSTYGIMSMPDIAYYEQLVDGWHVIRWFHRSANDVLAEEMRVYLNDDGATRIVAPSKNGWVPSKQINSLTRKYFANPDEAIQKCARIKYAMSALKDMKEWDIVPSLIKTLRFPEVEQLISLGAKNIAFNMLSSTTPKAHIKEMFGGYYNDKEKSVLRKVGLTKQQLDTILKSDDMRYYYASILTMMRGLFGNDLSPIDTASFERYINVCYAYRNRMWLSIETLADNLNIDKVKLFKTFVRLYEKSMEPRTVFGVFNDAYQAYRQLGADRPTINWYFDNVSDLNRVHDALVVLREEECQRQRELNRLSEIERRKKEDELRAKVDEKRKHYEYEDDQFIIRLPKSSIEIVDEGSKQRICIGGYTTRHAQGGTNLFFLRHKDNPDTPFYAIEMRDNRIVQIHGFGNKWLGNNPEAIPTVVRWLRKHGISCDNKILLCTASGYSSNAHYIPMPKID